MPSLIVDRYGDVPRGADPVAGHRARRRARSSSALQELLKPAGILERNDPKVRRLEGLEQTVGVLQGEVPETVEVEEGGVRFAVDLVHGQKTGLFLDQRENHLMVRSYARGRVLDAFTYDGGFALQVAATRRLGPRGGRLRGGRGPGRAPTPSATAHERDRPRRQRLRPAARASPGAASASTR